MSADAELQRALAESRRTTREATVRLQAVTAQIRRDHAAFREESSERRAARAKAARDGASGHDARRLQERIDAGETTMEDVVNGRDHQPSAVLARQSIVRNLRNLRSAVDRDPEVIRDQLDGERLRIALRRATESR